jgi:hypothetical protein
VKDGQSAIQKRLSALGRAIANRDWADIEFHYNNVVRGVARLVTGPESMEFVDEAWEPLQPTEWLGRPPEVDARFRERVGDRAVDALDAEPNEVWKNNLYTVIMTRDDTGTPFELSIRRNDRRPVHDWRHFQMIKNQLVGFETEAVELYPAQSRIMDTANQYYLHCLSPGMRFPVGWEGPTLLADADEQRVAGAEQRPLPPGWESTMDAVLRAQQEESK